MLECYALQDDEENQIRRSGRSSRQADPKLRKVHLMGFVRQQFMMYASHVIIDLNGNNHPAEMAFIEGNTGLWSTSNASCTEA